MSGKANVWLRRVAALATVLILAGCDDGGGGGGGVGNDVGDNDPNLYVAIGDSITKAGYPAVLGSMLGKPVVNRGIGGSVSADGAAETPGILSALNPGYLLILYGANDVTRGHSAAATIGNLRSIIQSCKANKTVPVIATLTPMFFEHQTFHAAASATSELIRQLAREEDVALADLEKAFNDQSKYMEADGLHPNAAGTQLIAETFYDVLQ